MLQVQPCLPDGRWFPSFTYNRRTKRCQSTHAWADIYHPTRRQLPNCSNSFIRPHILAVHTSAIPSFSTHYTHTKTAGLESSKNRHPADIHTFTSVSGKCRIARVGFRAFKTLHRKRGSVPRTAPMDPHVAWLAKNHILHLQLQQFGVKYQRYKSSFDRTFSAKPLSPIDQVKMPFTIPCKWRVYSFTVLVCWIIGKNESVAIYLCFKNSENLVSATSWLSWTW